MTKGTGKGTTNNPHGRRKGSPNKATTAAREAIAAFVDKNTPRLERLLDKIEKESAKDAFDAITKVMEYHLPKLARQEVSGPDGEAIKFQKVSEYDEEIINSYMKEKGKL